LTATGTNSQVILNWNAAAGASSYILKRGTASGQQTITVSGTISGTSYADTSVTNGTTYYYVVTGSNSSGAGGPSNEASAKPAQAFAQWMAGVFPGESNPQIVGPTEDPDGDGMASLLEYFMGTNPASSDAVRLVCVLDGQGNAVVTFRMSKNLTGVKYSLDRSDDLNLWEDAGVPGVATDMGSYELMQVTVPINGNAKPFFRLSVSMNASP
jgi:hypothetical protein